jgi:hypothetical protein
MSTERCFALKVGHRAEGVMLKSIWQVLPFVIGVLAISIIFGWLAWYHPGFVVADAPVVVKIRP